MYNEANIPEVEDSHVFQGHILHSIDYKSKDERLKDKNVIVVGNSYSGVEISTHLVSSGHVNSLVNVFNRPYLILPRLIKIKSVNEQKNTYHIIPIDLLFGRIISHVDPVKNPDWREKEKETKLKLYSQLCPLQTNKNKAHPDLYYELDNNEPIREAVTDNYIPYVRSGKITPKKGSIKKFVKNGVIFDDDTIEKADAVIFCTGYKPELKYFDNEILKKLKFDAKNERIPIILYKHTIHPDIENFAMVGLINGLYFCGFENQARWVAKYLTGQIKLPNREQVDADMHLEESKRYKKSNNEYPRGAYNRLIDSLAEEANALPNFEKIKQENPEIYHMLWNNGTIPCHFAYNNEKTRETSIKLMKEVDDMINKKYFLTDQDLLCGYFNGDYLPTFKLAEQFSKNYKIPMHLFRDWEGGSNGQLDHEIGFKLIEGFDYYDKDKNGSITNNELPELLKWLDIDEESCCKTVKDLIKSIDSNNDGEISLIEFLNFAERLILSGTHDKKQSC